MSRLVLLACPALLAACLDPSYGRLSCPEGEVCSDRTPAGLVFTGRAPTLPLGAGDDELRATAIGGTQTIRLVDAQDGEGLDGAYGTAVTGGAVALVAVTGDRVQVVGRAGGSSTLRIVEPDGDALLDKVALRTAVIAGVELVPLGEAVLSGRRVAWLADRPAEVAIRLRDAAGGLVIDDSAVVTGEVEVRAGAAWDQVVLAPAPSDTPVTVIAGGVAFAAAVPRADAVDTIVPFLDMADADGGALLCFEARAGDRVVAGAGWSFAVDGEPAASFGAANCTMARPAARGRRELIVSAGARHHTVDLSELP
jgi:hypothetical protein